MAGVEVGKLRRAKAILRWKKMQKKRLEERLRSGSTEWKSRPDLVAEYQKRMET